MKSTLFTIGPFTAHSYGLMLGIAIVLAYIVAEKRAKKLGLKDELIFDLAIWCGVGGILGAKLLYLITQIDRIIDDPKVIIESLTGGFVVYGGIILGIFAGWLFTKVKKLPFLKYFDLVMPEIALAQAVGRVGCFLAGCCYGVETHNVLHVVFHDSPIAPNGVSLVPTQIYSSLFDLLHFFVLISFAKKKKADGQVAGLYLMLYSAGRFVIEFWRGDLERGSIGPLSTSQAIAIVLFVIGAVIVAIMPKLDKKVGEDAEDAKAEAADNEDKQGV